GCRVVVAPLLDRRAFPLWRYQRGGIVRDGVLQKPGDWTGRLALSLVDWVRRQDGKPLPYSLLAHSAGAQFLDRLAAFVPTRGETHCRRQSWKLRVSEPRDRRALWARRGLRQCRRRDRAEALSGAAAHHLSRRRRYPRGRSGRQPRRAGAGRVAPSARSEHVQRGQGPGASARLALQLAAGGTARRRPRREEDVCRAAGLHGAVAMNGGGCSVPYARKAARGRADFVGWRTTWIAASKP